MMFHFLDASPAEALETARKATDGQDVRIGGGPTVIRDFLATGLSITYTPWWSRFCSTEACASGTDWSASRRGKVEATSSPSGVTHVAFTGARV